MKIERTELLEALKTVMPGIDKKEIIEQMTHYMFTGTHIVTYNDKIHICYPFETDFVCSIPAKQFYAFIKGIEDEQIVLKKKKKVLTIKTKNTQAEISTIVEDQLRDILKRITAEIEKAKWKKLPTDFIKAIKMCRFSASKDEAKQALVCLHISGEQVESTDANRLSVYKMEGKMKKILFRAEVADELVKFDPLRYTSTKSWVHFKTKDGTIFSCRRVMGEFVDTSFIFKNFKGVKVELPDKLESVIKTLSVFTEEDQRDKRVTINLEKNKLTILASSELGWAKRTMKVGYNKKGATFMINPILLADVLELAKVLHIGENLVVFKSGNFKHAIALIRDKRA